MIIWNTLRGSWSRLLDIRATLRSRSEPKDGCSDQSDGAKPERGVRSASF